MILLAISSSETLAHWEQSLGEFDVVSVRGFAALSECLARLAPRVLILDFELSGLDGLAGVAELSKASPSTKIIALTRFSFDELELALFKAGVHGCCRDNITAVLAQRAVAAVERDELWVRRSITPRLIKELAASVRDDARSANRRDRGLGELTSREREIAHMIGNGETNKQIARQLLITERTVKAHVSGIFRKLGIADRLSLALRVSAQREMNGERVG